MRRWMAVSVIGFVLTSAGLAQDVTPRRLTNGIEARSWEAVGRLNLGDTAFCTGALIEPDLVLTAAHCLFDQETGAQYAPDTIEFLAGWRNGRASAYRDVRRAVVHAEYQGPGTGEHVRYDIALLELAHPIRDGKILPFMIAPRPPGGKGVSVVSYASGRSEAPALQEFCDVMAHQDGILVTTCAVDFGSSGAPIFVTDDGETKIVSVVSAKAQVDGISVSLGTSLDMPLTSLKASLAMDSDSVRAPVRVGDARDDIGAKFISQ